MIHKISSLLQTIKYVSGRRFGNNNVIYGHNKLKTVLKGDKMESDESSNTTGLVTTRLGNIKNALTIVSY